MQRSSDKIKPKTIVSAVFLSIFFALSGLVIGEAATPSGASGKQSDFLSLIAANIINTFFPSETATPVAPTTLSVSSNIPSYTDADNNKVGLFPEDKAIVGTTRMFTYTLSYPSEATLFSSNVELVEVSVPKSGSYSKTVTASSKGGAIRIIPLEIGSYSFLLKDAAGHAKSIDFDCVDRISPNEISVPEEAYTIKVNETKNFPFSLSFGSMTRSDESVHHYLNRFIDPTLAEFASSDTNVFTVAQGGVIKGKAVGEADLLFKGERVTTVKVEGNAANNQIASMSLSSEKDTISPLDYDYSRASYGTKLTPHFYDALGNELELEEKPAIRYESEDHLIAMVENDRYEKETKDEVETFVYKEGGFVAGYRNKGTTKIIATLEENPSIKAEIELTSKEVPPTSASFAFSSGGKKLENGVELVAGSTVSITSDFAPANCGDKNIHVDVSDSALATVVNNDTNSPQINLIATGNLSISAYSVALGESTKSELTLKITPKPVIPDSKMNEFASFFRKAAGHLSLFAVTAIFGTIGLFLSGAYKNKKEMLVLFAATLFFGFALAGLSELIQAIPVLHRGATWMDVGIDFLGYFMASVIIFLIFFLIRLIKDLKKKTSE